MICPTRALPVSLILVIAQNHDVAAESSTVARVQPISSSTPATCHATSVNYLTHHLPQQCLKTNWSTVAASSSASPNFVPLNSSAEKTPNGSLASPSSSNTVNLPSDKAGRTESQDGASKRSDQEAPTSQEDEASSLSRPGLGSSINAPTSSGPATEQNTADVESPLDNAKFLSFEDWKKQNLAGSGQSVENMGRKQDSSKPNGDRRRPQNLLDSLEDDGEIELDFSGFGTGKGAASPAAMRNQSNSSRSKTDGDSGPALLLHSGARSKDAGRTCKERFNFASFDCAANILKTNPQCKSSSSILVENKDSYMLNECGANNKFLIIELCDHVQIDTVVLANFEFFSSMFRTFRLSVSDRYPIKIDRWKELGLYEARNSREIQAFLVENPLIWARYLRIEFLTHYGSEYYCPLSLARVHGTTMMEDYRHQEELARGEIDVIDEEIDVAVDANEQSNAVATTTAGHGFPDSSDQSKTSQSDDELKEAIPSPYYTGKFCQDAENIKQELQESQSTLRHICNQEQLLLAPRDFCPSHVFQRPQSPLRTPSKDSSSTEPFGERLQNIESKNVDTATSIAPRPDSTQSASEISKSAERGNSTIFDTVKISTMKTSISCDAVLSTVIPAASTSELTTAPSTGKSIDQESSTNSSTTTLLATHQNLNSSSTFTSSSTLQNPTQSPPATQESFFKSVHKRLLSLEANATLSLQYIESQSQLLRSAFSAVEKRQLAKTSAFLESLNSTVLADLSRARAEYEQLWQSTVLELAGQREDGRRENEVLSDRVRVLAEEVVGQKRMMVVQATLLLLCLGLIVFARVGGARSDGIDIGLLQGVQHLIQNRSRLSGVKSSTDLPTKRMWGFESPWISPPQSRHGTRSPTARGSRGGWDFTLHDKPLPPAPPESTDEEIEEARIDSDNEQEKQLEMRTPRSFLHAESPSPDVGQAGSEVSRRRPDGPQHQLSSRDKRNITNGLSDSTYLTMHGPLNRRTSLQKTHQSAPTTPVCSASFESHESP